MRKNPARINVAWVHSTTAIPSPDARFRSLLLGILLIGAVLRLYGFTGGLPAVTDSDEPLFVVIALKMLAGHGLNPGWFGHPATITFYCLVLVFGLAIGAGLLTGHYSSLHDFIARMYLDPSILFISGRLLIILFALISIILTAMIARRLFYKRVALISALLLALNPLHISYSQIIRTDIQVTVFMLLCVLYSIRIARRGLLADYAKAGFCLALACATKWPAANIAICMASAALYHALQRPDQARTQARNLAFGAMVSVLSLALISPYLILDYRTVMANLGGEMQLHHLGATGGGFWYNIGWYIAHPFRDSIGTAGILLVITGMVLVLRRGLPAFILLPPVFIFMVSISYQTLIWDRWVIPLLPFVSIFIAYAVCSIARALALHIGKPRARPAALLLMLLALTVPMVATVKSNAAERITDTRNVAAAWVMKHVPSGQTIFLEHFGFDLLRGGWRLIFPAGDVGCVDVAAQLGGKIKYDQMGKWRGSRAIVDYGTVNAKNLGTCAADYAIFSHYDRYARERAVYPHEAARYEAAIRAGTLMATFRPVPGEIGGPTLRIVRMKHGFKKN